MVSHDLLSPIKKGQKKQLHRNNKTVMDVTALQSQPQRPVSPLSKIKLQNKTESHPDVACLKLKQKSQVKTYMQLKKKIDQSNLIKTLLLRGISGSTLPVEAFDKNQFHDELAKEINKKRLLMTHSQNASDRSAE